MVFENKEFSLFKYFPEPVFIIAPDGTILEANQVFASRFFSNILNIKGQNIYELLSHTHHLPELAASRKKQVEIVLSTGNHVIFDDEKYGRIYRSAIYPIRSDQGTIDRLLIIVHDVTEQIAAEKQARHTDRVFKALLDAVPGSVFVLDDEFLLISCNDYAFELFGDHNRQIRQNNFFNLIFDEDRSHLSKRFDNIMESGLEKAEEARMHIHEDRNSFRWFSIHAQRAEIDNRRYLVIVCIDIHQHKMTESQLLQYKKWLIMAMESANTGVWDWNIVTNAALWSNRMWELYGIERVAGRYPSFDLWKTALHPDDKEAIANAVREAVNMLADLNIEYRVIHPDGSTHWIMVCGKPVIDRYGKVTRYCGTAVDISDQKQLENEITLTREHLDLALEKCHIGWFHLNLEDYSTIRTLEHARIFGYGTLDSEWSFEKFLKHVTDEDRGRVKKLVLDSITNRKDFVTECQIMTAQGEKRRIWASASIQYNGHGKATHVLGIVQDITDRRG